MTWEKQQIVAGRGGSQQCIAWFGRYAPHANSSLTILLLAFLGGENRLVSDVRHRRTAIEIPHRALPIRLVGGWVNQVERH
jgi:hypothetical protein